MIIDLKGFVYELLDTTSNATPFSPNTTMGILLIIVLVGVTGSKPGYMVDLMNRWGVRADIHTCEFAGIKYAVRDMDLIYLRLGQYSLNDNVGPEFFSRFNGRSGLSGELYPVPFVTQNFTFLVMSIFFGSVVFLTVKNAGLMIWDSFVKPNMVGDKPMETMSKRRQEYTVYFEKVLGVHPEANNTIARILGILACMLLLHFMTFPTLSVFKLFQALPKDVVCLVQLQTFGGEIANVYSIIKLASNVQQTTYRYTFLVMLIIDLSVLIINDCVLKV